jgi:hypothetical protein
MPRCGTQSFCPAAGIQESPESTGAALEYPCFAASSSHSARVVNPCGDSTRPSVTGLRQNQRNTTPPSTGTAFVKILQFKLSLDSVKLG